LATASGSKSASSQFGGGSVYDHSEESSRPGFEDVSQQLGNTMKARSPNFIVIDGLDKYSNDEVDPALLTDIIFSFRALLAF